MKFFLYIILNVLFYVQFSQANRPDDVVATVGSYKITSGEFNKRYAEVKLQSINPPTKEVFLEDLVRYHMGLQEAEKRNLRADPIVKDRFEQELYKALLEKELSEKLQKTQVTDAEMKKWYKNNPEIKTSHILTSFRPGASQEQIKEAKDRATKIYEDVKKSKRPFHELAKIYSDDPMSKQSGGDVGWQSRMNLVPPYYDAALNTKLGEIKGLIETQFGFHIIKVTGRRRYDDADKRSIRVAVYDVKRRQLFDEYFDKLKKQYPVKIIPGAL